MIANTTQWTYDVGPPFLDTTLHPMAMAFMGLLNVIMYELTRNNTIVSSNNDVPEAAGLTAHEDTSYDNEDNFIDDPGVTFSQERVKSDSDYLTDVELSSLERNMSVHPLEKPPTESDHTSPNLHDSEQDIWNIISSINDIESNSAETGQTESLKSREITLRLLRKNKFLAESADNEINKGEGLSSSKEKEKMDLDVSENKSTKSRGESQTMKSLKKDDNSLDTSDTSETNSEEKTREFMKQLQKVRFQFRKNSKSSSESVSSTTSSESSESYDSSENQIFPENEFMIQFEDDPWDDYYTYNDPENELQFLGPFVDSPFEAPLSLIDLLFGMPLIPDNRFGMTNQDKQENSPESFCELHECDKLPSTPITGHQSSNPILDNWWLSNPSPTGSNLQGMVRRDGAIPTSPFYSPMEPIYDQVWNPFLSLNENTPEEEMGNIFFDDCANEEDGIDDELPVVFMIISRYEQTIYPEDMVIPEELSDCPQEPFSPDLRMEARDLDVPQLTQNSPQILQNVPQIFQNGLLNGQNVPQIIENAPLNDQNIPQTIQNAPLIMNQEIM